MQYKNIENRIESLRRSLDDNRRGGPTLHFAKRMANAPGCQSVQCTIIGHYRTFLFEFPRAKLLEAVEPCTVYADDAIKAVIASNLPDYFELSDIGSPHYSIDVSLRAGIKRKYFKILEQTNSRTSPNFPLFVVIEQNSKLAPIALDRGECLTMNEYQDGVELIDGGRQGERAYVAVKTIDGSWPEVSADMHAVNAVLAAVKIEQEETDPIRELFRCSCFVEKNGQAVYPLIPTASARASSIANYKESDVREKVTRIDAMLQVMAKESHPSLNELFEALMFDKIDDDGESRLWYLRLWQAIEDAKGLLGYPQLWNSDIVIAGQKTPRELNEYRNNIAHWYTGRMEFQFFADLQRTAMELLRRKYRNC